MKAQRFRRRATSVVVVAAVLALLAGCNLLAPQETKDIKETSDGVNGTLGEVFIGNAVLLAPDSGTPASLVTTLVNQGDSTQRLTISTSAGDQTVSLDAAETLQLGTDGGERVEFEDLGAKPGALADVTFDTGSETLTLQVPVLNGAQEQYHDLVP